MDLDALTPACPGCGEDLRPFDGSGYASQSSDITLFHRQYCNCWYSYAFLCHREHCWEVAFLSDGGERHLCERHRRAGVRRSHGDHVWTLWSPEELQRGEVHLHLGPGEWVGRELCTVLNWVGVLALLSLAAIAWSVVQEGDRRDRAIHPLPLLTVGELHTAAECWSDFDQIFTSDHWLLLHGCASPGSVTYINI